MSIISDPSLHLLKPISTSLEPTDKKALVIEAIEEFNLDRVMELLDQGADPLMDIPATEKVARALLKLYMVPRVELENLIGTLFQQIVSKYYELYGGSQVQQGVFSVTVDDNFISLARQFLKNDALTKEFIDFIKLGSEGFSTIPDEKLEAFYFEFSIQDILSKDPHDVVPFKLTEIACMLKSLPLIEKLVECGVDITNPKSYGMGGLYSVLEKQLLSMLDKLYQEGEEVPFHALTNPKLTIHERIEKILVYLQLQGIELPEIYNSPFFINSYELSKMTLNQLAYVDYILAQGVPKEKVFNIERDFIFILQSKDCLFLLDYLKQRGYDLEGFFFKSVHPSAPVPFLYALILMSESLDVQHGKKVAQYLIDLFPQYFENNFPEGHFLMQINSALLISEILPYLNSELSEDILGQIDLKYTLIMKLLSKGVPLKSILYLPPGAQKWDEKELFKLGVIALKNGNENLLGQLEELGLKRETEILYESTNQSFSLAKLMA